MEKYTVTINDSKRARNLTEIIIHYHGQHSHLIRHGWPQINSGRIVVFIKQVFYAHCIYSLSFLNFYVLFCSWLLLMGKAVKLPIKSRKCFPLLCASVLIEIDIRRTAIILLRRQNISDTYSFSVCIWNKFSFSTFPETFIR